jgi:hypothetical protein
MTSSVIREFSYEEMKEALVIKFISGISYQYENVAQSIYDAFRLSISQGILFNRNIRGLHQFKKMDNR